MSAWSNRNVKFFFICSLNVAAKRRYKELKKKTSALNMPRKAWGVVDNNKIKKKTTDSSKKNDNYRKKRFRYYKHKYPE